MPLPASLIASIISAILESASSGSTAPEVPYDTYVTQRKLPPEAGIGRMLVPTGDGTLTIDGQSMKLSPAVQFRNEKNLIVMPMSLQNPADVVYLKDRSGAVHRVWLISQAEADSLRKD